MEAMLDCCGEHGFREASVELVTRRYGGSRGHFYRYFRNKADCFIAAYEWKANELADCGVAMLGEEGPTDRRLQRTLRAVAALIEEQEALAKALFLGVHLAGREAFLKRKEIIDRLSRALDAICREDASEAPPPPLTAEFLVSAVDQAVSSAVLAGRPADFAAAVPDLTLLICQMYEGSNTAPASSAHSQTAK